MKFFESHAHLYFEDFDNDRDELIERLLFSDIEGIVNAGVDLKSIDQSIKISEKFERVYAACGFHPSDLNGINIDDVKLLREFLKHDKMVAVGEAGIDLYRDRVPFEIQRKFFVKQLELALEENVPVIVHSRSAEKETMEIIEQVSDNYTGVFHCFAGGIDTAFRLIEKGFYISFTGSITYKNNDREAVVKEIPLDKILIETDSPFLTPVPNRGKRNDPSNLKYIAEKIAKIKEISIEEVASVTTDNCKKLFNLK